MGGGINQALGINRHTQLYIRQIISKNQLNNTRNLTILCNKLYEKRAPKRISICILSPYCDKVLLVDYPLGKRNIVTRKIF